MRERHNLSAPYVLNVHDCNGWSINLCEYLSDQTVLKIFGSIDKLSPTNRSFRRRGFVPLSTSSGTVHVYVKCNMIRYIHLNLLKIPRALRMLAKGSFLKEGNAYVAFRSRGIPTAKLCLYGDYEILGIRTKEIIVIEATEGETVKKRYIDSGDLKYLYQSVEFLANLHNHGLVHGDCMLHNFFVCNDKKMILLDLEESSFLTEQLQIRDLVGYGASLLRVTGSISLLSSVLIHYFSRLQQNLKIKLPDIVNLSVKKVKKAPFNSLYVPADRNMRHNLIV